MTVRLMIARPLPGLVGESRRVCHLFPLVAGAAIPAQLTAYCGAEFAIATLEKFDKPAGMPCEACLRKARPVPQDGAEE